MYFLSYISVVIKLMLDITNQECRCEALRSSLCFRQKPDCFVAKPPRNDIEFVSSV